MPFLAVEKSDPRIGKPYAGRMLIDGALCEAHSGAQATRHSPAHDIVVGIYPEAAQADLERAVAAARAAFDGGGWSTLTAKQRAEFLLDVASGIRARAEDIALLECLETGKPLAQARGEVDAAVDLWKYAAALARTLHGDSYDTLGPAHLGVVLRQPLGVVAMITPWNFPFLILSQKLPFALAAGCTAVVKPSELTNGTTLMLGEILLEAGLPKGVVNIVTGPGPAVGQPLATHRDVDMISFTGSTRVGRLIAAEAGGALKKVALELGGKNPQIIFPDCDWAAAVDAVVLGAYFNAGECCNSGSRILVHRDIAARFTEAVVERARQIPMGDPLHPDVKVGAIISAAQLQGIQAAIAQARQAGATLALGGERIATERGLFLQPTIVTGVSAEMAIAREEIFGPVLSILSFESMEQAIEIANDTCYGLSAAVWSQDIDICTTVARQLRAGTVWVNTFLDGFAELPFGGMRDSGLGRELGRHAVDDYTEAKTVQLHVGRRTQRWLPA